MVLRLYNTLTKTKETFVPLDPNNVRVYVCGPTVYDTAHIGNARPVIVFDVLFRLLRHLYGVEHVTYVRNITDIDDKIIKAAEEQNVPIDEITKATAKQFHEDVAALGCLKPTHEPRATKYVPQMIAMIEALIKTGHAYAADGHVLYDVSSKPDYGKLARRSLDEMIAGARVEVAPYKKNPMDFVLWKPSPPDLPGWDSPWGRGRPGWHIECSAMGEELLCAPFHTHTFDIHGGGIDLVFPHHENEIAQSESVHNGHPLAKIWMHNGFLQVEGQKMSKSLENFRLIHEERQTWSGDEIRYAMLKTHYRQPINWTGALLEEFHEELFGFYRAVRDVLDEAEAPQDFLDALNDDINTPLAFSVLANYKTKANRGDVAAARQLRAALSLLGLTDFLHDPTLQLLDGEMFTTLETLLSVTNGDLFVRPSIKSLRQWFEKRNVSDKGMGWVNDLKYVGGDVRIRNLRGISSVIPIVNERIDARNTARKAKNFKEADRIRDELLAKGIVLKDGSDGTIWEVKR